ncbi:collagen alpha-2(VIII) chain-like [Mercenaria mercenaria]|uniref:collagen alpha-2(VIII) chain-like n=1 Tax=Mercenaria mercenaria TaxID=6596 RepID=UPI00234F12B6|nr:collagen alpha-2(VIII) chain-like [Mercenaria mercenaria]
MMFLTLFQILCIGISTSSTLQADPVFDTDTDRQRDVGLSVHQLADRLNDLEARDKIQEQVIVDLKKELENYKEKLEVLHEEITGKSGLISTLLNNTTRCNPEECTGKREFGNKVSRSRRDLGSLNVAFTAGLSRSILHAPAYHNIIFDRVETNIGNGYDSLTGVFTAPVSGTYVFYTSILVYNGREVFCRIVVNGVNMANTYGRGTDNRLDQGSQAVIVQLQKGHQVAVQNKVDDDAIFGNQDIYTTFSGFLLHSSTLAG